MTSIMMIVTCNWWSNRALSLGVNPRARGIGSYKKLLIHSKGPFVWRKTDFGKLFFDFLVFRRRKTNWFTESIFYGPKTTSLDWRNTTSHFGRKKTAFLKTIKQIKINHFPWEWFSCITFSLSWNFQGTKWNQNLRVSSHFCLGTFLCHDTRTKNEKT